MACLDGGVLPSCFTWSCDHLWLPSTLSLLPNCNLFSIHYPYSSVFRENLYCVSRINGFSLLTRIREMCAKSVSVTKHSKANSIIIIWQGTPSTGLHICTFTSVYLPRLLQVIFYRLVCHFYPPYLHRAHPAEFPLTVIIFSAEVFWERWRSSQAWRCHLLPRCQSMIKSSRARTRWDRA